MQLHFLAKKLIMKEHVKKNSFSVHVFNDSKLFLWVCCKTTDKVRRFFNEIKHCANNFYRTSNIWFCYSIFAYKIYCKYETKCCTFLFFNKKKTLLIHQSVAFDKYNLQKKQSFDWKHIKAFAIHNICISLI